MPASISSTVGGRSTSCMVVCLLKGTIKRRKGTNFLRARFQAQDYHENSVPPSDAQNGNRLGEVGGGIGSKLLARAFAKASEIAGRQNARWQPQV
jgi:hypothetical protein